MGFMDKLKFWKKKEETSLETSDLDATEESSDLGLNEPLSLKTDPSKKKILAKNLNWNFYGKSQKPVLNN